MGRRMLRWLALALLVGCKFRHGAAGLAGDASGAADSDAYGACFGSGLFHTCLAAPPPATYTPAGATLDTSSSADCTLVLQDDGSKVCLIAAGTITIDGALAVTGSYPLVLLGTDQIVVDAPLDVSSHRSPASVGPGADWPGCAAPTAPGPNGGGAGGGAGGSFGGAGGAGGEGNNGGGTDVGTPGMPGAAQFATLVRGGCRGDTGAVGANATPGGAGASSGGAIYLLAGTSITVAQPIAANGAGGAPGNDDSGGGGGGAGGLVGLEAPTITVTAIVAANGGGGGGGGDGNPTMGGPGSDGMVTTTVAAPGGTRTASYDTSGGAGSVASTLAVAGTSNPAGGGGGGGSVGVIYVRGTLTGAANLSPPASP
ncbi:MAG: hypothetical protein ACM31C_01300 [Acidobacteriota bacterium]